MLISDMLFSSLSRDFETFFLVVSTTLSTLDTDSIEKGSTSNAVTAKNAKVRYRLRMIKLVCLALLNAISFAKRETNGKGLESRINEDWARIQHQIHHMENSTEPDVKRWTTKVLEKHRKLPRHNVDKWNQLSERRVRSLLSSCTPAVNPYSSPGRHRQARPTDVSEFRSILPSICEISSSLETFAETIDVVSHWTLELASRQPGEPQQFDVERYLSSSGPIVSVYNIKQSNGNTTLSINTYQDLPTLIVQLDHDAIWNAERQTISASISFSEIQVAIEAMSEAGTDVMKV